MSSVLTINTVQARTEEILDSGNNNLKMSMQTPEQLHHLNVPSDKGFDGVLITTKLQGGTYIVMYATERGRMSEFETTLQNMLGSVKFGSVGFSGGPSATPT